MLILISWLIILVENDYCYHNYNIFPNNSNDLYNFPMELFGEFENYTKFIYFDSSAINYVQPFLTEFNKSPSNMIMKNADEAFYGSTNQSHSITIFMVFLTEKVSIELNELSRFLRPSDVTFFFIIDGKTTCDGVYFHQTKASFIFDTKTGALFTCKNFFNRKRSILTEIQKVGGRFPVLSSFFNNFTDLGGYEFQVGFSNFKPIIFYSNDSGEDTLHGPEYKLLLILSEKLNFTYNLILFEPKNMSVKDQEVAQLRAGKLDFSIGGASVTYARSRVVNFMAEIFQETYFIAFTSHNEPNFLATSLFVDLSAISVVSLAVIAKIFMKLFNRNYMSIFQYLEIFGKFLCDQGTSVPQQKYISSWKTSLKLLMLCWGIICCILLTFFKVALTTRFISTSDDGIMHVQDLFNAGYTIGSTMADNKFLSNWCEFSETILCSNLKKIKLINDKCENFHEIYDNKIGLLTEGMPLVFFAGSGECNKKDLSILKKIPSGLGSSRQSWMFQKKLPFLDAFSRVIYFLDETGFLSYWYKKEANRFPNYSASLKTIKKSDSSAVKIQLSDVYQPYMLLLCGYLLSLVIFVVEISVFKFNKNP